MNQGGKFDRARVQDGQRTIEARTAGVPRWKGQGARCLPAAPPSAMRSKASGRWTTTMLRRRWRPDVRGGEHFPGARASWSGANSWSARTAKLRFRPRARLAQWPTVPPSLCFGTARHETPSPVGRGGREASPRGRARNWRSGCRQHRIVRERQDSAPKRGGRRRHLGVVR